MADNGFWSKLKKPVFVLAPMANVTDAAFRRIICKYGKPDVFWTEFVSVEGLLSRGKEKLLPDFWFDKNQHPIVAQIFGGKPEQFYEAAKLIVSLGFDGIDINMGCPHDGVEKSGACAILMKDPALAQKIILETKRGVADAGSSIPVSVKTRIGYNKDELETWLPALLETKPAVITLHLRTRKEMSSVPAHWERMARAVEIARGSGVFIFGNGDVKDLSEARQKVAETGCDGVMLGRAIFGNPWLFAERVPTTGEKLNVALEHTKLFEELFGEGTLRRDSGQAGIDGGGFESRNPSLGRPGTPGLAPSADGTPFYKGRIKPFDVMKKHFKAYVNGFDGAKELRAKMMEAQSQEEIAVLIDDFLAAIHG